MKTSAAILAATFLLAISLYSCSCGGNNHPGAATQPTSDTVVSMPPVVDLTSVAVGTDTAALRRYSPELSALLKIQGIADTADAAALRQYAGSPAVGMFGPEVRRVWTDSLVGRRLAPVAANLRRLLPEVAMPGVFTVVWPYRQSVVALGDTALLLALNHYLGATHDAYRGFPEWLRRLKEPSRLGVDVAEAIVSLRFPYSPKEAPTVLSRLVREGTIVEATMRIAATDEATALGLSEEEMQWCIENEGRAWDTLLNRRLLFSTDTDVAEALIAPGPATTIINPASPGRLGRFIGHRIVSAYLAAKPETTLASLLSPEFYSNREILSVSRYQSR